MASFPPLDSREEESLHKTRLLPVEERPFKRISRRIFTLDGWLQTSNKLPTPPPDGISSTDTQSSFEAESQRIVEQRGHFRDDVLHDFAAFEGTIARFQFLHNSNQRERERYEADKQRILETAQAVKVNTAQLRIQLEEAKAALEQRKKFDQLSDKIYSNKLLRPRADQEVNLAKLEEECRELERESESYAETWKERREQFNKIVEEGLHLRRLIRDEKEEVERREGMDGAEEDGEVGEESRGGQTPKHSSMSGNATPRPDDTRQGTPEAGGLKPKPLQSKSRSKKSSKAGSRAATPATSRAASRASSRAASPATSEKQSEREDSMAVDDEEKAPEVTRDTVMVEAESTPADLPTPRVTIEEPAEEKGNEAGDQMDTT